MKMVKSLLLGTAAGLIAVGGAQAADLPVKAKAVEYVKICTLYGAGFYYIPGSDTCIKLGGYLRAEVALNAGGNYSGAYSSVAAANNRLANYYSTRAREDLNIDTRTATEYGVVRTYFDAVFTWTTDIYTGSGTTRRVRPFTRNSEVPVCLRRTTQVQARSRAVRSASTTPSSSSPASPWVSPCRSSTRPGSTIPATTSTSSSAAAAPPTVSISSPTLPISVRA
ncbi:hypothetical protein ACVWWP_004371 [Bradyrhizobium sp. LM3.6]